MENSTLLWIIFVFLTGGLSYLYGKHVQSLNNPKKYEELATDELENKKDVSLYREEPKDTSYLKKELERERETKRKLVEQYESELSYLKTLISKSESSKKSVKNIQDHEEKTQKLFEEMSNELGPMVQIVNGSHLSDDDDVNDAIEKEINLKP
jgi:flagellar motility protein MotE (MotC chaperone)